MDRALLIALAAAALSLLALLLSSALTWRTRRLLAASEEEVAVLRERLEQLSRRVDGDTPELGGQAGTEAGDARPSTEYLITSLSHPTAEPVAAEPVGAEPALGPVGPSGREFATAALGESLVRVLALGHGVRRAMSAENRNRIRFEMHREVKRARRQRRRDVREARRYLRNERRTGTTAEMTPEMTATTGDAA
jgi:hypothetical protein